MVVHWLVGWLVGIKWETLEHVFTYGGKTV